MRKILFAGALALAAPLYVHNDAHALGNRSRTRSVAVSRTTASGPATAQAKSEAQARTGRMAHVGGVRAGTYEGVGFSTAGPAQALAACCYSNSGLPVIEESVVRGRSGWFATRVYAASRTAVNIVPAVGLAVVTAPAKVFRFATGRGPTCANGTCGK